MEIPSQPSTLVRSDENLLTKVSSHSHVITKKKASPSRPESPSISPARAEAKVEKPVLRLVPLDVKKVWWMFLFHDSFDGTESKLLFDPASVPNPGEVGKTLLNRNYLGAYIKNMHLDPNEEDNNKAMTIIAGVGLCGDWCVFSCGGEDDTDEDYKALEDPSRVILHLQNQILVITSPDA
jgi:hypothetical protein